MTFINSCRGRNVSLFFLFLCPWERICVFKYEEKSLLVVVYPGSKVCCQVGRAFAPVIFSLCILWSKWKNILREHHDPFYFSLSTLRVLSAK